MGKGKMRPQQGIKYSISGLRDQHFNYRWSHKPEIPGPRIFPFPYRLPTAKQLKSLKKHLKDL